MRKKPDGGWGSLTAEQRQARIEKMVRTRAERKAQRRLSHGLEPTRQALPSEIEHIVVAIPHSEQQHSNGMGNLDDLAQLIIAVWRKL